jgi:hypothetical protein
LPSTDFPERLDLSDPSGKIEHMFDMLGDSDSYTKEAPGWRTDLITKPRRRIEITTPTGHHYESSPPAQPGDPHSMTIEQRIKRMLDDAA